MLAMKINGQNGGPFVSHRNIMNSSLKKKYNFIPLWIPRARVLLNPIAMFKLVKSIKKVNPEFVQIAGLQLDGFLTMIVCKFAGVKTVLAIHGSVQESMQIFGIKRWIIKNMERYTVKHSTFCYGVSDYVSSWEICKLSMNYFGTIYNISQLEDSNDNIRQRLKLMKNDIIIVSTGRVEKEKGYDILLEIIKKLKNQNNIKFVISGEGTYRSELQAEIKRLGYEDRVFLLGYQKNITSVLNGADIFVICTKHETLCISLLEAAMSKLPLVATNVGGIPEIIEDSVNGYLVNNFDIDIFCEKIINLSKNSNLRKQMGKNAFRTINKKFNDNTILKKLDSLYQSVLKYNSIKY